MQPRLPVALTPTGNGSANRQVTVPSGRDTGLEGFHQLDLLISDSYGNRRRLNNLWRGIIDTLPPRVTFTGDATGNFYLDDTTGDPVYDIRYSLKAKDLHLDIDRFQALCIDRSQSDRDYVTDPWVQAYFPDLTLRDELSISCHDWDDANESASAGSGLRSLWPLY